MSINQIFAAAQGGAFYRNISAATGLEVAEVTSALNAIAPAIATKLKDKAAADPEAFEQLLDLIEDGDGSDINDPDAICSSEAVSDGREILEDLYGSAAASQTALGKLAPGLDTAAVAKLGAIGATSVLAALAASNVQGIAGNTQQAAASGEAGGGLISIIIGALVKGFMQSAQRQLAPKRRRRRYTSYYGRRRTTTRRRRKRTVGIDDIFKDILGGRR